MPRRYHVITVSNVDEFLETVVTAADSLRPAWLFHSMTPASWGPGRGQVGQMDVTSWKVVMYTDDDFRGPEG